MFHSLSFNIEEIKENSIPFSGIANSGEFERDGLNFKIDFSNFKTRKKNNPVLLDHDLTHRVGFGQYALEDNQLRIKGLLFKQDANPYINELITSYEEGFPWELSIRFQADHKQISKNNVLLYNPIILETSFVSIGQDQNTDVFIELGLSKNPKIIYEIREDKNSYEVERYRSYLLNRYDNINEDTLNTLVSKKFNIFV